MDGRNRLYGDLAHLWPLMSPPDHYKEEARYWLRELRARLAPGKRRILDLGTGGGHHLHQLTAEFDATAVDRVDYPVSKDGWPMYLWVGVGWWAGWWFPLPVVPARGEELIEKYLRALIRDCRFRSQIASNGRRVGSETLSHECRQARRTMILARTPVQAPRLPSRHSEDGLGTAVPTSPGPMRRWPRP